ncbi:MAG: tRNA pseudouridine(38-40) synthase TruA [Lachnospiraceae bacterium]|nr:tRNA pseudouridine(38-40) synthase TruA [Lachnospiraceae bacterium]
MKRVMLTVAYDGTDYCGWQVQPNGDTIEGQLNKHLSELLGEPITVIGASRTDSGVHALCNLAVFDTQARMPAEKISYALNQRLPEDIKIQKSEEVASDFHPRKVATRKTYEYKIYNAQFPNPTMRLYSHFTYVPMDAEKMQEAAKQFVGEHDFAAVSTFKPEVESTVRTIYDLSVTRESDLITIRVTGNGFLYNMVRIIAGTLMEVGRGRMEPSFIPEMLASGDREKAGPTAPAQGLTLVSYTFEK